MNIRTPLLAVAAKRGRWYNGRIRGRMRSLARAALVLFTASTLLAAQSPTFPVFEVASVKLDPRQGRGGPRPVAEMSLPPLLVLPGGRVESYGHTLRNLIAVAYDINMTYQKVEGTQEVLETQLIVSAKAAAPSLTPAEAKVMLRTLLEERFQLRWRLQPRDVEGYLLVPAREDGRPGSGLRPFVGDCDARKNSAAVPFASPDYEDKARCGWTGINARQRAVGVTMNDVAERLMAFMATPVSNRTDWPGRFTFDVLADTSDLPYETRVLQSTLGARKPVDAPQLLEVFRRELGLKLVKERTTINDFIVEQVSPLVEN